MENWSWFRLSIINAILISVVILIVKQALNLGVSTWVWLMYFYAFNAILIAGYLKSKKQIKKVSKFLLILLITAAVLGIFGNVFLINAIKIAPNPGYVSAVTSTQIILVALASVFFFKSEFPFKKGLGTLLVVIGVVLLGL